MNKSNFLNIIAIVLIAAYLTVKIANLSWSRFDYKLVGYTDEPKQMLERHGNEFTYTNESVGFGFTRQTRTYQDRWGLFVFASLWGGVKIYGPHESVPVDIKTDEIEIVTSRLTWSLVEYVENHHVLPEKCFAESYSQSEVLQKYLGERENYEFVRIGTNFDKREDNNVLSPCGHYAPIPGSKNSFFMKHKDYSLVLYVETSTAAQFHDRHHWINSIYITWSKN